MAINQPFVIRACCAAALIAASTAHARPITLESAAGWKAVADNDGRVKHCAVEASFHRDWLILFTGSDRPGALRLTLGRGAWRAGGQAVVIAVLFPSGARFMLDGVRTRGRIRMDIPAADRKAFISDMTASATADFELPGSGTSAWTIDLRGAAAAFAAVPGCVGPAHMVLPGLAPAVAPDAHLAPVVQQDLPPVAPPAPVATPTPTPVPPATPPPLPPAVPTLKAAPASQNEAAPQATAPPPTSPVPPAPVPAAPVPEATPEQVAAAQQRAIQDNVAKRAAQDEQAQRERDLAAVLSNILSQSYQKLKVAGVQFDDAAALFNTLVLAKPDFESFTTPAQVSAADPGYIGNFVEVTPQNYTYFVGGFSPHGTDSLVTMSGTVHEAAGDCNYTVGLLAISRVPFVNQLGGKPEFEEYKCAAILAHRLDDAIGKRVFGFTARVIKDPASTR